MLFVRLRAYPVLKLTLPSLAYPILVPPRNQAASGMESFNLFHTNQLVVSNRMAVAP